MAVLDGPVDLSHPCLAGADLTRLDTLVQEPAGTGPMSLHGTHVTSLIFGTPGSPVTGLAPRCRGLLLPVFRDGGDGRVPQMDLARAIERAVEEGAHVINISGGERTEADQADALLARALRLCEDRGVLVVSAVGNDGADTHQVPAAVPSVLAVGAAAADGRPLDISNWGADYRGHGVLAPGQDIEGAAPGGGLAALTGSSFATPLVAGTAALLVAAQLAAGGPADPAAAGQAVLTTATAPDCADPDAPACRRGLGGSLDAVRAHALITRNDRTHWNDRNEEEAVTTPAAAPTPSEAPAPQVAPAAYETPAPYGTPAAPAPAQPMAPAPAAPPVAAGITADGGAPPPVAPAQPAPPPVQASPAAAPPAAQAPVQAAPVQAAHGPVQAAQARVQAASAPLQTAPVPAAPAPAAPAPWPSAPAPPAPAGSAVAPPVHAPYISTSAGVRPSCGCGGDPAACACGGAGGGSPRQLIYAIGTIGFDYPTEARRDSFRQQMPYVPADVDGRRIEQAPDPYSPRQLRDYLASAPWVSDKLTWTLTMDGATVYALEAEPSAGMDWSEPLVPPVEVAKERKSATRIATEQGRTDADLFRLFANPPVSTVYRVFRDAIWGQALNPDDANERDGYISRVSVPGVLTNRTTRLYSGQVVPVVEVKSRGLYTWNEAALVDSVFDQVKNDADVQSTDDKSRQAKVQLRDEADLKLTIRSLLDKIYYQFRNLGQTSADRALNYMGTNAFLFGDKVSEGLLSASKVPGSNKNLYALDTITVTKSPYCRVGSDCQDVTVTFYDPEDERRSRLSYLFTIDVSDELPVTLAPVHTFLGSF
ncbi:S8 family serine peptidase [Streptomyces sp. TX20-6-3]|uniref:cyanobactin maturation protease PatG family protein n=1 Tax=Streptomyces sp. TX20-6-3 TaxID=3028705 RepID=UPI0029AE6E3F|nr:S8 family serine peptidase [Streptomyces sp. TX20-6-3]MDX2560229.1 S8 family serine peptidase [Streptomyces sp. TX20-6-3]